MALASAKENLARVRNRNTAGLNPAEMRRWSAAIGKGGIRVVLGRSTAKADRALEQVWADAEARLIREAAAEDAALAKKNKR